MSANSYDKLGGASLEDKRGTSHEQLVAKSDSVLLPEAKQTARRKRFRLSDDAVSTGGKQSKSDGGSSSGTDESNDFTSSADEFDESDDSSEVGDNSSGLAGYTVLATCPVVSHAQREAYGLRVAFSTTTCDSCAVLFGNNRPGTYVQEDHVSLWGMKSGLNPLMAAPCLRYTRWPQPATAAVGDPFAVSVSTKSTAGATGASYQRPSISHFILLVLQSVRFEGAQNYKLMVHSRHEAPCSQDGAQLFELKFETAGNYLIAAFPVDLSDESRVFDLLNAQGCSCLVKVVEEESNRNLVGKMVKQTEASHSSEGYSVDNRTKEGNENIKNYMQERETENDYMIDDNDDANDSIRGLDVECHLEELEDQAPLLEQAIDLSQILETSAETIEIAVELLLGALPKLHKIADRIVLCAANLSANTVGGRGQSMGLPQNPSSRRSRNDQKHRLTLDYLKSDLNCENPVILALTKMLDLRAMLVSTEVATSGTTTSRSSTTDPTTLRFAAAVAHTSRRTARVLRDAWLECATKVNSAPPLPSPAASPAPAFECDFDLHCDYCACCGLPHNTTPAPAAQDDDSHDTEAPVKGYELYICDTPGCAAAFHGVCAETCSMILEACVGTPKGAVHAGKSEAEPKAQTPPQPPQESAPRDPTSKPQNASPNAPERTEKPKQTKLVKELIRDLFWRFKDDSEKRTALMTMLEDLKAARLKGELTNIPQEVLARAGLIVGEAALRVAMVEVKARYSGARIDGSNVKSHGGFSNSGASSSSSSNGSSSTTCDNSSSGSSAYDDQGKADSRKKRSDSSSDSGGGGSGNGGRKRNGEVSSVSHSKAQEYLLPWTRPDAQGEDAEETGWSCPFCHAAWALRAATARGDTATVAHLMATGLASPFDAGSLIACPGGTLNSNGNESGVGETSSHEMVDASVDAIENGGSTSGRNSSNNAGTSADKEGEQPLSGFVEWPGAESALHAAATYNDTRTLSVLLPPLFMGHLEDDARTDQPSFNFGSSSVSHTSHAGSSHMISGPVRQKNNPAASFDHPAAPSKPDPSTAAAGIPATPLKDAPCADIAPPPTAFVVQDVVMVAARTGPGQNKPGGVARITSVSSPQASDRDDDNDASALITYSVQYVLGGREQHLPAHLLKHHNSLQSPPLTSPNGRRAIQESSSGSSSSNSSGKGASSSANRGSRSGSKGKGALFGATTARSLPLKLPSWCLPRDARGLTPLDCTAESEATLFLRGRFIDTNETNSKEKRVDSTHYGEENSSSVGLDYFVEGEDLAGGREPFPVNWTWESSNQSIAGGGDSGGSNRGPKRFTYVCTPVEGGGVGADWGSILWISSAKSRHPSSTTVNGNKCGCACESSKDVIKSSRSSSSSSSAVDTSRVHLECGPSCRCERVAVPHFRSGGWTRIPRGWCPRRRAQQGLSVRVHVVRRFDGTWELRAAQTVPPRSFVGCFAGEVITWAEASERVCDGRARVSALVPVIDPSIAAELAEGSDEFQKLGELCPNVVDASTHRNALAFAAHRCARSATLEMHLHLPGHRDLPRGWPSLWTGSKGLESGDELTFTRIWPLSAGPSATTPSAPGPLLNCPCDLCQQTPKVRFVN